MSLPLVYAIFTDGKHFRCETQRAARGGVIDESRHRIGNVCRWNKPQPLAGRFETTDLNAATGSGIIDGPLEANASEGREPMARLASEADDATLRSHSAASCLAAGAIRAAQYLNSGILP
jgi:hypothetical protein